MRIVDTYADILSLFHGMNGVFDLSAWEAYAAKISPQLPDKLKEDSSPYDFDKAVLPIVSGAMRNMDALEKLHDSFLRVTANVRERFYQAFAMEPEVDIILCLGLCNGAGWASALEGGKVILLGVEKIIELDWCDARNMAGLVYHELGHIWHDTVGMLVRPRDEPGDKAVWQLYREGIAMVCSQLLCGDSSFFPQDRGGWLNWCEAHEREILAEYRRRVCEGESVQDFFGDWCQWQGYADVGYYLGCRFVRFLMGRYAMNEWARLDMSAARAAFGDFSQREEAEPPRRNRYTIPQDDGILYPDSTISWYKIHNTHTDGGRRAMMQKSRLVLVLHFGGPLASFVARKIRGCHVFCEVLPCNASIDAITAKEPGGIVLAGESIGGHPCDPGVFDLGIPLLRVQKPGDAENLTGFLFETCGLHADWNMEAFIENAVLEIREQVGSSRVLLGLSGGVDSAVCAALIHRAVGSRLHCVFVNHGLMRKDEPEEVRRVFTQAFTPTLVMVDASARFFEKLRGITDPEAKRKAIGAEFIEVFAQEAMKLGCLDYLAQGTIYPDIIESGGSPGDETIKSHHNVGGLPEHIRFAGLVEPLRMLFKDEVREVGKALGLPESMVCRQPFPGPGLGVRVMGELTPEKVEMVRASDAILREEVRAFGLGGQLSQFFTVLTGARSVGVKAGKRAYDNVICIRAVTTTDFMAADWARLPYEMVARVSERITAEVPGVSRVVLDVTGKPPAAIEWE